MQQTKCETKQNTNCLTLGLTNKYDIDDSNFHRISCGVYGFNVSNISQCVQFKDGSECFEKEYFVHFRKNALSQIEKLKGREMKPATT